MGWLRVQQMSLYIDPFGLFACFRNVTIFLCCWLNCNNSYSLCDQPKISDPFLALPAGKYFYFQGSRNAGSALLTGPRICGQHCMQFFYHMQGPNMGKLNLYQKFKNSEEDRVWMMAHDQGSEWNEAVIDLGTGRTNCFQASPQCHSPGVTVVWGGLLSPCEADPVPD